MRKIVVFSVLLVLLLATFGAIVPRIKATNTPSIMILWGHGEVVRNLSLQLFSSTYPNPLSTVPLVTQQLFPTPAPTPSDFPVVLIIDPGWYGGSTFNQPELGSLYSYIQAGGTVVVSAEWGGGGNALTYPQTITNFIAGVTLNYVVPQTGVDFSATYVASHPFTVGVTTGGLGADYHYNDDEALALPLPSGWTSLIEGPDAVPQTTTVSLLATLSIGNGRFVFANGELGDPDIYYGSGMEVGLVTVLRNIVSDSFLHAIDEQINEFASEIDTAYNNGQISWGTRNSLFNKLGTVAVSKDGGHFGAAVNKMDAFINELDAQYNTGHIPAGLYTTFLNKANTIKAGLQAFLP